MPTPPTGKLADPKWRAERARKAGSSRTTPEYHVDRLREIVERTRADQGLPPVVVDELTLGQVAALVRAGTRPKAVR